MLKKIFSIFIFVTFCLASLMGCASNAKNFVSLQDQVGAGSNAEEAALQNNFDGWRAEWAWWHVYEDPNLDLLMSTALKNNIDFAQSAININRALYQAGLVGADLVPSFSGGGDASASRNLTNSDPSVRSFGGSLAVSYEVDLWQKLRDTADAQEWEYKATREDWLAVRLALVNNIMDAYFFLGLLEGEISITRQSMELYSRIADLVQVKFRNGKVDGLEPAQARQSYLAAKNNLIDLERQRKETEQSLRDLLNLRPGDPWFASSAPSAVEADLGQDVAIELGEEPQGMVEERLPRPNLLQVRIPDPDINVPFAVLFARPDLRVAEDRLQSSLKILLATEKSWYPSLSLGASLSSSSDKARTAFDVPFSAGVISINLPFLDWNRLRWATKISEADFESAKLSFEQSVTTALNEVDAAKFKAISYKDTLKTTEEKYAYDVQISTYYKERYDAGASELSDWLGALNTEASSRMALLQDRYALIQQENALYKALGGRYVYRP